MADVSVTVFDAKPSVGRKFLVAGKSGLNLTNAAGFEDFLAQYSGRDFPLDRWRTYLRDFDNTRLCEWAAGLGVESFVASSGKVFPVGKKAAPLLRRWVQRLRELRVTMRMKHEWTGWEPTAPHSLEFRHEGQVVRESFDAVVLAMGGASWPQTGSTGSWIRILEAAGIAVEPLQSANCGWCCDWSEPTRSQVEGQPLHNVHVSADGERVVGELMCTRYGFEGTPIYGLGRALRAMSQPAIIIDFKPTFTVERLVQKMESARRNFFKEAKLRWKLNDAAIAILRQFYGEFNDAESLAQRVKSCRIPLTAPRPIEEAISTAGGVAWRELDADLMLNRLPGVYCAGEMIDWEAPTGGFLLQGCLLTGGIAGRAAAHSIS